MKLLTIGLISIFALSASADTFIDHTDGDTALVCSNDSGEWVCKAVPEESLESFGWEDVEGVVPIVPYIKESTDDVIEPSQFFSDHECGC